MKTVNIQATSKTPRLVLNAELGKIEVFGRSIPEDTEAFFQKIFEWLEEYAKAPAPETTVQLNIEYYNTGSSKQFLELFFEIQKLHLSGASNCKVIWIYAEDDEEMEDNAKDFARILKIPFILQPAAATPGVY
jgi:sulfur relay (sulfurtransferase) DsrC/TusE family protein